MRVAARGCLLREDFGGSLDGMAARAPRYWTVALTRFGEERRASSHVERQGFEFFLPWIEERGVRGWRRALMFPGYLFVRLDSGWESLQSTKGISRLLFGAGSSLPSRVERNFVELLRLREDSRGIVQLHPRLSVGDKARVSSGSFEGFVGVVQDTPSRERCRLLMEFMGRSVVRDFESRELALP